MAETDNIHDEFVQIFQGTLEEDFMVTAQAVSRPFCKVMIPVKRWSEGTDYPLTYVPIGMLTYPLKKGNKVWVKMSGDNVLYPYLWKVDDTNPMPIPSDTAPIPSSPQVDYPSASDPDYSFAVLANMLFVASNASYAVIRFGDNCQFFWSGGFTFSGPAFAIDSADIQLGGKNNHLTAWEALNTALQGFITAFNSHVHPVVSVGSPTGVPAAPASLDLSGAKTAGIRVP